MTFSKDFPDEFGDGLEFDLDQMKTIYYLRTIVCI